MRRAHRCEQHENLWRTVVPWCLHHSDGVLPPADIAFLEEILSMVTITDPQRGRLTNILSRVIDATCKRPWDKPA